MDHYASPTSYSTWSEEQDELVYSPAPQNPEDVICSGSDTEQTAEEIRTKRRRYENIARRYLCGHRLLIQSASLRGPLSQESGWINPWRQCRRKEKDNVMKRAADHGLGYLNPKEALAWCKATAEAEARTQLDQFDSMKAVYSEESDSEDGDEEDSTDGFLQAHSASRREGDGQVSTDHAIKSFGRNSSLTDARNADRRDNIELIGNTRSVKRPADSQWLKGSYVSKKARWEALPASSPTPIPDQQSKRDRRRRQTSARSAGSENGRPGPISQPTTPWSHDAQQRTISPYSGSTAQALQWKCSRRDIGQQAEALDELHEHSQGTTFVSAPDLLSGPQRKTTGLEPMDHSSLDLGPDEVTVISAKDTSSNASVLDSSTSVSPKPNLGSNKLPKLSRRPKNLVDMEVVEDDSFITEVAPSSRNLEKFQYRKKRRESKEVKTRDGGVNSLDEFENTVDRSEKSVSLRASSTVDLAQQLPVHPPNGEVNADVENSSGSFKGMMPALLPNEKFTRVEMEASSGSRKSDENYPREVAMISVDLLPGLQIGSSFSPFSPFAPFGASKPAPTPEVANRQISEALVDDQMAEDDVECATSNQPEIIEPDNAQASGLVSPDNRDPFMDSGTLPVVLHSKPSSVSGQSLDNYKSIYPEDYRPAVDASTPDLDRLPMRSNAPQSSDERRKVSLSKPLTDSLRKSEAIPEPKDHVARLTPAIGIDDDSAQSFHSTAPKSSRKPHSSPAVADNILTTEEQVVEAHSPKLFYEASYQDAASGETTNKETLDSINEELNALESPLKEDAGSNDQEAQDEMEIIQTALSQNCGGLSSRGSSQSDNIQSLQPSISAAPTEPGGTTPLGSNEEDEVLHANEDQEIWEGCGPQSPWATENFLPEPIPHLNPRSEDFVTAEQETSVAIDNSHPYDTAAETSNWQALEHPVTPDNDGIKPFKAFMTPTPSPERSEAPSEHDDVSNTQLLIKAATNNPWTSNSKQHSSQKSKKRVSFGVFPSEERPGSQTEKSTFSKQGPASPSPPQILDQSQEDDIFDDGTTVMNKFAKHFSAAAGCKRLLSGKNGSLLSSPAVGAMAEAFIAADRETFIEHDRLAALGENPTQHLKPKSDARTNLSPSDTTDYELEANFDDFLGEAGNFLEDWSVDSEVKKVKDSREKRSGRSDTNGRRSLFGMTSVWS